MERHKPDKRGAAASFFSRCKLYKKEDTNIVKWFWFIFQYFYGYTIFRSAIFPSFSFSANKKARVLIIDDASPTHALGEWTSQFHFKSIYWLAPNINGSIPPKFRERRYIFFFKVYCKYIFKNLGRKIKLISNHNKRMNYWVYLYIRF